MKYLLVIVLILLVSIGQFLLKKGIILNPINFNLDSFYKTLFSPYIMVGLLLYGLSSMIWLFVINKLPLSVAYPSLAMTYPLIIIISFFLLGEPLSSIKIVGIIFIILGISLIYIK